MTWGSQLKFLMDIEEDTGETPPALKFRPVLTQWQQPFMSAFHELSGSRNYHMAGAANIPISEILAYLELNEIYHPDDRQDYVTLIQCIDNAYLESQNKGK